MTLRSSIFALSLALPSIGLLAQTPRLQTSAPAAASAPTAIPALVPYSGIAPGVEGKPAAGEVNITFLIYKDEKGGEPLWTESQVAAVDSTGHYKVQLGASNPNGLPSDLFATGEARWLEAQIAGQPEQPRVLLASVPYALKAADAATLGGLPASAFALAGTNSVATAALAPAALTPDAGTTVTTTGGTSNKLAKFSGSNTIVNSILYDNGTEIGIGTTSPNATLTVDGTTTLAGSVSLPAVGTATASKSYDSQLLKFYGSAYNSSSKGAVSPHFEWQVEPSGNNTSSPGGNLSLLASPNSATATETGFYINASGIIHFASGQTFPAPGSGPGSGTITGVTAGTGLTGGGTSGKVTLNVNTGVIPTLSGNNSYTGSNTFVPSIYEDTDVNIDNTNANNGGNSPGLRFGSASGEGIASKRTSGGNQYGLDFYTEYATRMQISEFGYVGIGTAPAEGIMLKSVGGAEAGDFENNSSYDPALFAANDYTASVVPVFETFGENGVCVIDTNSDVDCEGTITGSSKDFKIDHPLDPANKYLVHTSVESSEMMNIYSGNVTTDELGVATVTLPSWFEAENGDFRYQLTTIGRDAHAWVSQEVANGQFKIATNATNVKVSWQITAVRQDGYAKAHPLVAEQEKPAAERGLYRHPEFFGQPKDKSLAAARNAKRLQVAKATAKNTPPIGAKAQVVSAAR